MIPAGITLSPKWNGKFWGILVRGINDFIIAGVLGVGRFYFFIGYGKEVFVLKGRPPSLGLFQAVGLPA